MLRKLRQFTLSESKVRLREKFMSLNQASGVKYVVSSLFTGGGAKK